MQTTETMISTRVPSPLARRSFPIIAMALALTGQALAGPMIIDDEFITATMANQLGAMADAKTATTGKTLAEASKKAPVSTAIALPANPPAGAGYRALCQGVYLLGSAYKCGKCERWHLGAAATAWCLTADGVMVTNHHVFQNGDGVSWGVCDVAGKVYRVLEILATDPARDVALFRVDAKGLTPLALGAEAEVGDNVSIISHPDHRFFFRTSGEVARYSKAPGNSKMKGSTWMAVTADFAKGSSGGPIFNADGGVVGMVSSTQSIYYGLPHMNKSKAPKSNPETGPLQMVIKNCVPLSSLRAITQAPAQSPSPE